MKDWKFISLGIICLSCSIWWGLQPHHFYISAPVAIISAIILIRDTYKVMR